MENYKNSNDVDCVRDYAGELPAQTTCDGFRAIKWCRLKEWFDIWHIGDTLSRLYTRTRARLGVFTIHLMRFAPPLLLLLGGFILLSAFSGRIDVVSEDVSIPPYTFMEWALNLSRGATINVAITPEVEINDSKILVLFIMDEKDFSNYVSENLTVIHLSPGQRIFVDAYWSERLHYRVPHRSRWHVIVDNKHFVHYKEKEKGILIEIYITTPYRYLMNPGVALLSFGLASLIWKHRAIFPRIKKESGTNSEGKRTIGFLNNR